MCRPGQWSFEHEAECDNFLAALQREQQGAQWN
jgi:hypothetical protein